VIKSAPARRPLQVDVQTRVKAWAPRARDIAAWAGTAIGRRAAGGELGVRVVGAAESRRLNARYRGKDKPTNVLSFPAAANPEGHLGDIALAYGVCAREALEQGKPLAHHLQHLVAHGVLHLLGYDHMSDDEAETMEGLERVVLAGLGAPDPYLAGGRDHD